MPAYVCSKKHIMTVASEYCKVFGGNVLEIANELYAENIKSVNYRYGTNDKIAKFRTIGQVKTLNPIALYKIVGCLQYQTCEDESWVKSEAYEVLNSFENYLLKIIKLDFGLDEAKINDSKQYQTAMWSI